MTMTTSAVAAITAFSKAETLKRLSMEIPPNFQEACQTTVKTCINRTKCHQVELLKTPAAIDGSGR
jgi:hypothetical protein